MNRKTMTGDRRRRKLNTALWSIGVGIIVIGLIYWERIAILYLLCTVSIAVLLLIVAFSDLAHEKAPDLAQTPNTPSPGNRER
jgi:hypothetical protein